MSLLPAVRERAAELQTAGIDALLVDIHSDTGAVLTERFAFEYSPTFLVFAPDGTETLRANTQDDDALALAEREARVMQKARALVGPRADALALNCPNTPNDRSASPRAIWCIARSR